MTDLVLTPELKLEIDREQAMSEQQEQFHYFASTVYNWTVADTKEEALQRLAVAIGQNMLRKIKKRTGFGVEVQVVKVLLPLSASYLIDRYLPSVDSSGKPVPTEPVVFGYLDHKGVFTKIDG